MSMGTFGPQYPILFMQFSIKNGLLRGSELGPIIMTKIGYLGAKGLFYLGFHKKIVLLPWLARKNSQVFLKIRQKCCFEGIGESNQASVSVSMCSNNLRGHQPQELASTNATFVLIVGKNDQDGMNTLPEAPSIFSPLFNIQRTQI